MRKGHSAEPERANLLPAVTALQMPATGMIRNTELQISACYANMSVEGREYADIHSEAVEFFR